MIPRIESQIKEHLFHNVPEIKKKNTYRLFHNVSCSGFPAVTRRLVLLHKLGGEGEYNNQ
jgi:hypothetical protein